jgi:hypothetical protein
MAVTASGFSNSAAVCANGFDRAFPATIDFKFLFLYTECMVWIKQILRCPSDILGYAGRP